MTAEPKVDPRSPWGAVRRRGTDVQVLAVLSRSGEAALADGCDLRLVLPTAAGGWFGELPDLVLLQTSAGLGGELWSGLGRAGEHDRTRTICDLLDAARALQVPTVVWRDTAPTVLPGWRAIAERADLVVTDVPIGAERAWYPGTSYARLRRGAAVAGLLVVDASTAHADVATAIASGTHVVAAPGARLPASLADHATVTADEHELAAAVAAARDAAPRTPAELAALRATDRPSLSSRARVDALLAMCLGQDRHCEPLAVLAHVEGARAAARLAEVVLGAAVLPAEVVVVCDDGAADDAIVELEAAGVVVRRGRKGSTVAELARQASAPWALVWDPSGAAPATAGELDRLLARRDYSDADVLALGAADASVLVRTRLLSGVDAPDDLVGWADRGHHVDLPFVGGAVTRAVRGLVYADVDLNVIDGSAVFVQTAVLALAEAGVDVTLVLKRRVTTDRLIAPLEAHDGVTVVRPHDDPEVPKALTPERAAALLGSLDEERRFDLVLLRGRRAVDAVVDDGRLDGRLWTYLTDVPQSAADLTDADRDALAAAARASRFVLCQTEELRGFLEASVPDVAGRAALFPPTLPADVPPRVARTDGGPLRLLYSGKFARAWNTLEMCDLPRALAERGVDVELHVVGDKIHAEPDHPGWGSRMSAALSGTDRVIWHGGTSRERALELAAQTDVALSWRADALDSSLELSTKVLEASAAGLPVLLNPSQLNVGLLGADYPLFATTWDDVVDTLARAAKDPSVCEAAAARGQVAAAPHRFDALVGRLRALLARAFPEPVPLVRRGGAARPLRVVVAGHDLKFMTGILGHLDATPGIDLRIDSWRTRRTVDDAESHDALAWADVVVCEWFGANAVWYSRHKRAGQRLVVRLHRVELTDATIEAADLDAIDTLVCVGEEYAARVRDVVGPAIADRVVVVPNEVDVEQFARPKLPGAHLRLGVVGFTPHRKRLDLALDVLRLVREDDPRFTLAVKGRMPWELGWVWRDDAERAEFAQLRRRVQTDPLLADAFVVDTAGGDVPAWLRGVGYVLSTSDDESFHLAPAEGMASGAVPVVRAWAGARSVYDDGWVHDDVASMAEAVLATSAPEAWQAAGARAQAEVRRRYDLPLVVAAWRALVVGAS